MGTRSRLRWVSGSFSGEEGGREQGGRRGAEGGGHPPDMLVLHHQCGAHRGRGAVGDGQAFFRSATSPYADSQVTGWVLKAEKILFVHVDIHKNWFL